MAEPEEPARLAKRKIGGIEQGIALALAFLQRETEPAQGASRRPLVGHCEFDLNFYTVCSHSTASWRKPSRL